MIKLTKQDMLESRKRTDEIYRKSFGDPTISREDAKNIAVQMKRIQDEECKNPKSTHDEDGLLIMRD